MKTITKEQFKTAVETFAFDALFNGLGWNNLDDSYTVEAQENGADKKTPYTITGIAQKEGFSVLQCRRADNSDSGIPAYPTRKQLETQVSKRSFEHLLVFTNNAKTEQLWQLPLRETGKLTRLVSFPWRKGQDAEGLFQKLRNIVFTLDEEDIITLADVKERVNAGFAVNSEKVTKKFYAEFVKQHDAFLAFIKGIDDAIADTENVNKKWYASLMLNRLMFCYFIQKKRFLDWNDNYLQDKLQECKKLKGTNNFYGFYRSFLLELFHDALANPEEKRSKKKHPVEFGTIPYLNGGLFEVHELETRYEKISIKDEAFENIFDFFDEWEWHLDTRVSASGRDINPDVIGYIFEKYINNRADMGAYYTKEDITDYIGKNTIVPFLLEKTAELYPAPFAPGGGFWQYLQDSGDEYIYDAVKKGGEGKLSLAEVAIPENIRIGIDTKTPNLLERRKYWNTATPETIGLPTEIWRETITRQKRYFELKQNIKKGGIQQINDLITHNLNIRRLAEDYLEQTADKAFIRVFYDALVSITILDPTCGSGAFLFAALNILEPLYEVCLRRMEDGENAAPIVSGEHSNRHYYIYKSIILNNLYGVDVMREAAEIAKLRLFLKLAAEVDPSRRKKNCGLEPLPDIDFNIRSGNTLVGFATEAQLEEVVKAVEGGLVYKEKFEELKMVCGATAASFEHFKKTQMIAGSDNAVIRTAKAEYARALQKLAETLNRYLADTYGLGTQTQWKHKNEKEQAYQNWKQSHQPFHWFAEFYEIISNGGFDVVIGNPPYVEYSKVKDKYNLKNYTSIECNNLWAYVIENAIKLVNTNGMISFIVPMSLTSSKRMLPIQKILKYGGTLWVSNYESGSNPGQLFVGVKQSLSILIYKISVDNNLYYSKYLRFYHEERSNVFSKIEFTKNTNEKFIDYGFYKIGCKLQLNIMNKIFLHSPLFLQMSHFGDHKLYVHRIASYYIKCFDVAPFFRNDRDGEKKSEDYKEYYFLQSKLPFVAIINSSIFYMYWQIFFDNFKAGKFCIENFPINQIKDNRMIKDLSELSRLLMNDMKLKAERISVFYKTTGNVEYDNFSPKKSKSIIDEIDKALAGHYGFSEEELDFIINYDIKYRMGAELEGEE